MGDEERRYEIELDDFAWIAVRKRRDPKSGLHWAAALVVVWDGRPRTVCLYDNAHGVPERHWFRHGVKQKGEPISPKRSARLDMPAAIDEVKANWEGMVDRWEP
jgi:hypothetical protein